MRREFVGVSLILALGIAISSQQWPPVLWSLVVLGPLWVVGLHDVLQTRHTVLRNYPVVGHFRYLFEAVRPELQQYFVESNTSGRPIPREIRAVVYQRAKGELETLAFGTQRDVYSERHEWVNHSLHPVKVPKDSLRVKVGGPQCTQPYLASILGVSAMSYGALSKNAVSALNLAAKDGGFFHNTGEGGISPYHLLGGDLVWQVGTGYFGARDDKGNFCSTRFAENAKHENVKMIEIKLSQGAKPGKGGILPGPKVTLEVAQIRGVEPWKSVVSPSAHSAFSDPIQLMEFVQTLRELSGGKPVGFKLCVGRRVQFLALCKAMVKTGVAPDFITVDGAEGGTGASPLEFSNSVGTPLDEGLALVHDTLVGFDLRQKVRIIAAGKVFTGFGMLSKMALGADLVASARGMMLALGCIHALRCNSNLCPTGVATTKPQLNNGLDTEHKRGRVHRYHHETVRALSELLGAMGYDHPAKITRRNIQRRMGDNVVKDYEDIFPSMKLGALLDEGKIEEWPGKFKRDFLRSVPESFIAQPLKGEIVEEPA